MKIFILDGIIVCSLDDKNGAFLSETSECFDGFYKHNLKLRSGDFYTEYENLKKILISADKHRIEVSEEVEEAYREMSERRRTIQQGFEEQRRLEAEEEQKREQWKRFQKNGCKGCSNCRPTGFDDDWKCTASGDDLTVKNCPGYEGLIYKLFNYIPFPTDKCPYKYEN